MSKNIMQSRHDEYHKLTRGERIGYGMGDFAQNLVFGTIGGFLAHSNQVSGLFCECETLSDTDGLRESITILH